MKKILNILFITIFSLTHVGYTGVASAACDPLTDPLNCKCGVDLDGDGLISDDSELQQCSNLADGGLCGIDKQDCALTPTPPAPAPGFYCPLTNTTSGCSLGAYTSLLDSTATAYKTNEPATFLSTHILGGWLDSEIAAATDPGKWYEVITCEAPSTGNPGKIDVELCTNPPPPPPILADPAGFYCPLDNGATPCYLGEYNYIVDPYTNTFHTGPRTPNYTTFLNTKTPVGAAALIPFSTDYAQLAVSCTVNDVYQICERPPATVEDHTYCPTPADGATAMGTCANHEHKYPMYPDNNQCVGGQGQAICDADRERFMAEHSLSPDYLVVANDNYNSTDADIDLPSCTELPGDGNGNQKVDVERCLVPSIPPPQQLPLEPLPVAPPPLEIATNYECPLAGNACVADEADGVQRCSPTQCADISIEINSDSISTAMLMDDAGYDANGNCLGAMYIFNGRAMRCHPSSIKTYFKNCCANDLIDDEIPENVGSAGQIGLKIEAIYAAGEIMYAASSATYAAINAGWTAEAAVGAGATAGGEAAAATFGGAGAAFFWLAVAAYLYEGACDQIDFETILLKKSDMCYAYGKRCIDNSKAFGCLKYEETYCCYNSKMARIIHEQGRAQFPDIDWGNVNQPNCRGFSPKEFQSLDFSRIDLTEYYTGLQDTILPDIPAMEDTININTQDKINNIR